MNGEAIDNDDISDYERKVIKMPQIPGAFTDRPYWMDLLQEIICIFIQILLTIIIVTKILRLLIQRNLKQVKTSQ